MKRLLGILLGLLLVLAPAHAVLADAVLADFGDELGVGARALAMGGAFVAVADDGTAAYWNPAGITQLKVFGLTPSIFLAGDWMDFSMDIGEQWPPNLGNLDLQLGGMFGVNFSHVGLSLLVFADGWSVYQDGPSIDMSGGYVEVWAAGMVTLAAEFTDFLSVGVNLKYIYGQDLYFFGHGIPGDVGSQDGHYSMGEATGYAADAGVMLKLGKLFRLGAVVQNYGRVDWTDQNYRPDGSESGPPSDTVEELTPILHVGLAFQPPVIGTLIAVQADRPLEGGDIKYRIGIEQSILILKLRAGAIMEEDFAVDYYTAGLGLKLGPVVLDLAAMADAGLNLEAAVLTAGFTF